MSRDSMTSEMNTAVTAGYLRPIFFFEFIFDSAPLRLFSGTGQVVWNSETYYGAGQLLSVDNAEETSEIEARNSIFSLTAIPSEVLSVALGEAYQGRPVRSYFGAYDTAGAIIEDPVQIFSGSMDVMSIDDDPKSPTVTLSAESDLAILRRRKERRYTSEDLKLDYPDDEGLKFVTSLQDKEIVWGK